MSAQKKRQQQCQYLFLGICILFFTWLFVSAEFIFPVYGLEGLLPALNRRLNKFPARSNFANDTGVDGLALVALKCLVDGFATANVYDQHDSCQLLNLRCKDRWISKKDKVFWKKINALP